eukprot:UN03223
MAVLDDIYADILTQEDNEEKEENTSYQAADDPNHSGTVVNKIQNQVSLRFDIDEMAEQYFGAQGVDEIFGDDNDKNETSANGDDEIP